MPESGPEKRYFTLDEANAYVPVLEKWLGNMKDLRARSAALQEELTTVLANVHLNTGGRAASDFAVILHRLQTYTARIREEGILVRDVESGLVDFPSIRAEREVFLCWKLGEENVQHWHELDTGFSGRKPIDEHDDDTPERT